MSNISKLIPTDPEKVMIIRKLTPDIMTCSTPFLRMGRIKIGGRGTIVRMATGSLAVFSPVALTETVKKETNDMGTVRYLVALDQEHHMFLESWHKAYPEAKILAPETLPSLRAQQKYSNLPASNLHLFRKSDPSPPSVDPPFDSEFQTEYVWSHTNKELIFHHKPSRTLIEADLLFNLPATEQFSKTSTSANTGLLTKLVIGLQNTQGTAIWQKRLLWYALSATDRGEFNESMKRISEWGFERIVPCHGDVIERDGKGVFEKVMEWHLEAAKKSG
ncbi:uncharacterized protein MYCFIDRAFT_190127 [Pseudocercospora fijiensis CIRAD86]|uniref:Metallo-beta-lactamase domain-containing protein n=1 Tax=Pseudocercospora fijiensis (strain CIRAD86) TaxID=383855 RepID=M3APM5_PSEFD|nr:uncharacterized protein MYCFIDRAFT_190127 [Pseudocercospora fijiensis CIRAD86]EME79078.1 hypothetical protein MYCFIDRAFT_190127 [Pseudocercospora fijiensis CIRAD86]